MPPKGKKTKAEEALAFLSDLDNFEAPAPPTISTDSPTSTPTSAPSATAAFNATQTASTPRASIDSNRPKITEGSGAVVAASEAIPAPEGGPADDEAASALAFLEAQLAQKRAPLTVPVSTGIPTPRSSTPAPAVQHNIPTAPAEAPRSSGWGVSSLWSTASSAISAAQKVADEGYKRVRTEGVSGVTGQLEQLGVGGVDLGRLRKEAEERLGGYVKGVDLEKLRHDLLNSTASTLTNILNTVAPPISAHETLELWLSHPMVGYGGVEGVIYRAWMRVLEQTESGEVIIIWSPPVDGEIDPSNAEKRSINPVEGWTKAWEKVEIEIKAVRDRELSDPQGRARISPNNPVTTIPIFLQLQPVLAPLSIPEPPLLLSASQPAGEPSPRHLYFILSLQDPAHSLRFTTITQAVPKDWLEVEYEQSDWVEERLVDVLRTGVEVIAQDYVATRMGLKPSSSLHRPPSPIPETQVEVPGEPTTEPPTESAPPAA